MGHNLWLHFGVDEHLFTTYCDVHYRVWTHSHVVGRCQSLPLGQEVPACGLGIPDLNNPDSLQMIAIFIRGIKCSPGRLRFWG